jgi:putative endonuclease
MPIRAPSRAPYSVYVLRCADGSLYTGIARDVGQRLAQHEAGRGARYTRGRGPLALCAARRCVDKGAALRVEAAFKRLSRARKEALLSDHGLASFARSVLRKARATTRSSRATTRG